MSDIMASRSIFEEPLFKSIQDLVKPMDVNPYPELQTQAPIFKAASTFGREFARPVTHPSSLITPTARSLGVAPIVATGFGIVGDLFVPVPGAGKGRAAAKIFKGFTGLSTKLLEKLRGRVAVSRQFIEDLTNAPDLKQAERNLIRRVLDENFDLPSQETAEAVFLRGAWGTATPPSVMQSPPAGQVISGVSTPLERLPKRSGNVNIPVEEFANKVKSELLPLKANVNPPKGGKPYGPRYETITLPDELRGPVANYSERIYESPIKTSAGETHFGATTNNYFAHTRVEDLPRGPYESANSLGGTGKTSRVIEIQSDLFQKGRLESEADNFKYDSIPKKIIDAIATVEGRRPTQKGLRQVPISELRERAYQGLRGGKEEFDKIITQSNLPLKSAERLTEISKLEPYRNTWHERIIREEVKQAAKDGKTKLQFPTGETAMKIEGLGERGSWLHVQKVSGDNVFTEVSPRGLKTGMTLRQNSRLGDDWIITNVLGDGKFRAVPKETYENIKSGRWTVGGQQINKYPKTEQENIIKQALENQSEGADISGKIDTNNPIYKFYEKEVGRYLINKYNAKIITDPQGVKWMEVTVPKEAKNLPVEAFGVGTIPFFQDRDRKRDRVLKTEPLFIQQ